MRLRLHSIFCLTCLSVFAAGSLPGEVMKPGAIFVESVRGDLSAKVDGESQDVLKHTRFAGQEVSFRVGDVPGSFATVVLSNGLSLHAGTDARFTIEELIQVPFEPSPEDKDIEPTASKLRMSVERGSVAFVHRERGKRPFSTMEIRTPDGVLTADIRNLFIRVNGPTTMEAFLITGSARYRPHGADAGPTLLTRQYLKTDLDDPRGYQLRDYTEQELDEIAPPLLMAQRSSRRVVFETTGEGKDWQPVPLVVLPKDFFETIEE